MTKDNFKIYYLEYVLHPQKISPTHLYENQLIPMPAPTDLFSPL